MYNFVSRGGLSSIWNKRKYQSIKDWLLYRWINYVARQEFQTGRNETEVGSLEKWARQIMDGDDSDDSLSTMRELKNLQM